MKTLAALAAIERPEREGKWFHSEKDRVQSIISRTSCALIRKMSDEMKGTTDELIPATNRTSF